MILPHAFRLALALIPLLFTRLLADPAPDAGQLAWVNSSLSSGSGTAEARAVTTDAAGNSYVVGRFLGTANFFGTMLTSTSASVPSGFLAKFSRDGSPVFVKKIGSNAWTELLAVAVKPNGEIYVAGSVSGTLATGAVNFVVLAASGQNALLLRLDPAGDALWGDHYGEVGSDSILALALTRDSHVAFGGNFAISITLGSQSFTTYGNLDIFAARIDEGNNLDDIRRIGGSNADLLKSIDVNGNNDLLVGASYNGNIELGSAPGQSPVTGLNISILIAKYPPNASLPTWYRSYSHTTVLTLQKTIANTADNSVVFGGSYVGSPSVGSPLPTPNTGTAGFVVKLNGNGDFLWNKQIGAGATFGEQVVNLAVSPSGMIGITGFLRSNTILDGIVLEATNNVQSVLTAMLDPDGTALWARIATVASGVHSGYHLAATPDSDFIFVGYSGPSDFGSGPIPTGTSNREAFVAYYQGFSDFEFGDPKTQAQWRENHFTVDELADAGFSADDRDPDGDGLHNFLEYALGQSPKQRDAPPGLLVPEAPGDLLYTYHRNPRATELTYQVEWTETFTDWHTEGIVESVLNPSAKPRPIEAAVPRGAAGRRFVRLNVTKP